MKQIVYIVIAPNCAPLSVFMSREDAEKECKRFNGKGDDVTSDYWVVERILYP